MRAIFKCEHFRKVHPQFKALLDIFFEKLLNN